uniref:ADF-H domain-containing protein n=1 Tax=Paramoeba aestuarina TaxID=180227 RepID=A0A7S4NR58_9EUKA
MASVINFNDECVELAQSVKRGKTAHAIFSITDSNSCSIAYSSNEKKASCEEQWEDFTSHLPKDSCAYGIAGFKYVSPTDQVERCKTVFVLWAPSGSKQKDKMMVAFSSNGVVNKIGSGGIGCRVQGGGPASVDYEEVLNQVLARATVK